MLDQQKRKETTSFYTSSSQHQTVESNSGAECRVSSHQSSGMRESSHMSGKSLHRPAKPRPWLRRARASRLLQHGMLASRPSALVQLIRLSTEQEALWKVDGH